MDIVAQICESLDHDWLPTIYIGKVRSGRTRSHHLEIPLRENRAEIQYTLLGIELKIGKRRFACPDLATARYMRIFARIGCRDFAVPYDITQISGIADQLETAWQRSVVMLENQQNRSQRSLAMDRAGLVKMMRNEIAACGAGDPMPLFDRETKHRSTE